jgi:hypothetical protein
MIRISATAEEKQRLFINRKGRCFLISLALSAGAEYTVLVGKVILVRKV